MELELFREYFRTGANGQLYNGRVRVCFTIELPWRNNKVQISCIPEGRYELKIRFSPLLQWHLHLQNIPGREWILIHPANDAQKELKGCIAPVTAITGPGIGICSGIANEALKTLVFNALNKKEKVFINIKKSHHEYS